MLVIKVVDIQCHCPVYRVGDCFRIKEGYKLVSDRPVCVHALQVVCPYYVPLSRGIAPLTWAWLGPTGQSICSAWTLSDTRVEAR